MRYTSLTKVPNSRSGSSSVAATTRLSTLDSGFDQPDNGDGMRLWNLAPLMPPGRDYSRINQGRKELIDHILASHALVQPLDTVTAHAVIDAPLASIDPTDPTARRNAPASDHAPSHSHLHQCVNPPPSPKHLGTPRSSERNAA